MSTRGVAWPEQQPPQHSPYNLQVRERVLHLVEVFGYSYQGASASSGHPSERTGELNIAS
jgi:hypothetical protein